MKKGLIFDMDGTLWDSSANVAAAWTERVRELGYERPAITQRDIMGVMGLTMDRLADIIFGDLPRDERMELLDKCCEHENEFLRSHGGVLYPELEETFARLRKKYHLYIVSNCQKGYIEAFLDYYGFWRYFDDIECYGNNLLEKGDNIALIVQRNALDRAWYVGDIQGDYDATMKAGLDFIHAAYGFGTIAQEVPELAEFRGLPELMRILDK
ncbi:MAG: HAD family hydrolase [Ruminococcus sp.]|nr:HAD family hydrolase [Ruminococcus sp.]